jgi:nucleotide-binding universal stress UspA family protein
MYRKILVPIDLAHAEKGRIMIDIARKLGGKNVSITLINVIEDLPVYVANELPGELTQTIRKNAQIELRGMAEAAGLSAGIEVRSGRPVTAILEVAKDLAIDLIVIASHQPGLQDYLLGSTAASVVRHAKHSVLVIR